MNQLDRYLDCSLKIIECLTDRGEADDSNIAKKLYGNCLQLTAVREGEGFKEHENLLVYRIWLSRIKLQEDRKFSKYLDKEKLDYVLKYVDKIHQKFLHEKLACLVECFCQCRAYDVGAETWQLFLSKINETFLVINNIFGCTQESREFITLRMIAFAKGMKLGSYGRQMLALQFFLIKAIALANDKTGTPEIVLEIFKTQMEMIISTNAGNEVIRLAEVIKSIILEFHTAGVVLWPTPKERVGEESPARRCIVGRRYYLKSSKPDAEAIKQREAEQKLQLEYKDYQSSTRFDIDELINHKNLESQKHSFFKSVESNLIYKGYSQNRKDNQDLKTMANNLIAVKKAYGDKVIGDTNFLRKSGGSEGVMRASMIGFGLKQKVQDKTEPKSTALYYIASSFKHGAERNSRIKGSLSGGPRQIAVSQSFKTSINKTNSQRINKSGQRSHRIHNMSGGLTRSDVLLLDSTREHNSDQFYIG